MWEVREYCDNKQDFHPHLQVKDTLLTDLLWDTGHLYGDAHRKGSNPLKELRRVEKNLDVLHVKTLRLPPVMPEV